MSGDDIAFDEGFEYGLAWAREAEGLDPHTNLLEMREDLKDLDWETLFDDGISPVTSWEWLAGTMVGDDENTEKLRSFWKWAIGRDNLSKLENAYFVKGFAEGAVADWSRFQTKGVF